MVNTTYEIHIDVNFAVVVIVIARYVNDWSIFRIIVHYSNIKIFMHFRNQHIHSRDKYVIMQSLCIDIIYSVVY